MGVTAIIEALIGKPFELPHGFVARFPELARVRWRRGGLPVDVAGFFLGGGSAAAITLWGTVFVSPSASLDAELVLHEFRHVQQFEASLTFPLKYLFESAKRGYFANRFEVDARQYATQRLSCSE